VLITGEKGLTPPLPVVEGCGSREEYGMYRRTWTLVLVVALGLIAACPLVSSSRAEDELDRVVMADCHVHLLDFLQNGDYLEDGKFVYSAPKFTLPTGQRGKRIEMILTAMDGAGVSHAMISGMPFLKKWSEDESYRSGYYLDSSSRVVHARDTDYVIALAVQDYARTGGKEAERQMKRLYPFVCGFDSTDMGAVDMIVKRLKEFPGVFKGIGEVMSRHDDLTNLTTGERPRGNHPSLFRIYDFGGELGIPVSIHHNIAPVSPGTKPKPPLYLNELLEAFREFPQTTLIWSHAGVSRRVLVEDLTGHLDKVLAKHGSHVYIDLSWVVFENYILKDLDGWAALIEKHPDNFMIGSDKVGRFDNYRQEIRKYNALLRALKRPTTVEKVARGNFLRIMRKEAITLPVDYCYPEGRYTVRPPPKRDR
jgi:hypothetical protein